MNVALSIAVLSILASIGFATWTWFAVTAASAELLDITGQGADFELK